MAEVSACVFVNVITNKVVSPALIVDGVNDFEMPGRLGVMGSLSAAVQVPVEQPKPLPVFVTPEGTDIEAVFVTCVCANAGICIVRKKTNTHRPLTSAPADFNPKNDAFRKLSTFCLLFSKNVTCYQ